MKIINREGGRPSVRSAMAKVVSVGACSALLLTGLSFIGVSPASAVGTTASTTVTSAAPASPQIVGTSVTITSTVTPTATGPVGFWYSTNGTTYTSVAGCTGQTLSVGTPNIATCVTTALPIGTVDLISIYSGDTTFAASTSAAYPYVVTTGATASTTATTATPASPQIVGTSVTITSTVSPTATGTVNFEYSTNGSTYTSVPGCGAQTLSVGTPNIATCVTTALPIGTVDLNSVYSGNSTFAASTSAAYPYLVTTGATASTTAISATPASPQLVGTSVTITSTVTSGATGTVNFEYSTNGSTYASVTGCAAVAVSSSTASCVTTALPIGTVDLNSVYSGNGTYAASTSAAYPYLVTTGATASTTATSATPASPQLVGTSVAITATVTSGASGTVNFEYSTNGTTFTSVTGCSAQSISGTTATCITTLLPVGTVDLNSVYSGNSTYVSSTSVAYPYLIRSASTTTVTSVTPASPQTYGTSVTITATVTTGATGTVSFESSPNGSTWTALSGCTAQPLSATTYSATCTTATVPAGTAYINALYSGDATYITSTSTKYAYVVALGTQATLAVTSLSGTWGQALALSTSGGSGTGAVTFSVVGGTATGCTVSGSSLTVTSAGTCIVTAQKAADANYLVASSSATTVTFVVPGPKAIRVVGFVTAGKTKTITITGSGFYGRPTVTSHAGTTARVTKDSGKLLTVKVSVKAGSRNGVFTFTITLANHKSCKVRYIQRA